MLFRSNSLKGMISTESPLGKAILGRKIGEKVWVKIGGQGGYEVVIRAIDKSSSDAEDKIRGF